MATFINPRMATFINPPILNSPMLTFINPPMPTLNLPIRTFINPPTPTFIHSPILIFKNPPIPTFIIKSLYAHIYKSPYGDIKSHDIYKFPYADINFLNPPWQRLHIPQCRHLLYTNIYPTQHVRLVHMSGEINRGIYKCWHRGIYKCWHRGIY